ncbi:MAG: DNA polymerase III subunit gamma/tau, partial [bacterium]
VVGQGRVVKTLKNAITSGRIAHAYLFCGPRGVGKTSIARILAKGINCQKGPTDVPCNTCSNCRDIDEGRALDIHEIDGASNNGVDDVRDIRERVKYLPSAGQYKIYIIDEVHMLSIAAFNALLKTLEEPPKHVIFVLATTEPHKLPATIISRCQRFDFRRISESEIAVNLKEIARKEGLVLTDRSLELISQAAEGGMRDALSLLDRLISCCGAEVLPEDVEDLLGLVSSRLVTAIATGIVEKDSKAVLKQVEAVNREGHNLVVLMKQLMDLFHQLFLYKLDDSNDSRLAGWKEQDISLEEILQINKLFLDYSEKARGSSDPLLLAELFLVKMACIKRFVPVEEILNRLEQLEKRISGSKALPAAPTPKTGDKVGKDDTMVWSQVISELKKTKFSLGSLLEHHGTLVEKKEGLIRIEFERGFSKDKISDPANLDLVRASFSRFLASPVKLEISEKKADLFSKAQHRDQSKKKRLEIEVEQEPMILRTISIFEGKLVKSREVHYS